MIKEMMMALPSYRFVPAVAAFLPLAATAQPVVSAPVAEGTILTVSAQGRTTRVPDLATIRAGVVTQGTTAAATLADNAVRIDRVVAELRRSGIAPADLSTASVSLQPQYHYADGQAPVVTGYRAGNTVAVRFHEIARAGRILDALVAQGANEIEGPTLALDDPDAALDLARVDAMRRARARADLYARAAGLRVDRIVSINEASEEPGTLPVMHAMRAQTVASAPTQVLPGQTSVTASITVRFVLR